MNGGGGAVGAVGGGDGAFEVDICGGDLGFEEGEHLSVGVEQGLRLSRARREAWSSQLSTSVSEKALLEMI